MGTIRFEMSELEGIKTNQANGGIIHLTAGNLPWHGNVLMSYSGSIVDSSKLSLVDATLNNGDPCGDSAIVTATSDYSHSGVISTSIRAFTVDTTTLSTTVTFAVCYGLSQAAVTWRDSGIRLQISKISKFSYGVPTRQFDSANDQQANPHRSNEVYKGRHNP